MNEEQRIVYVRAQILCAEIELESMKAANHERRSKGMADAYDEQAFMDLLDRSVINHNSCITELVGH